MQKYLRAGPPAAQEWSNRTVAKHACSKKVNIMFHKNEMRSIIRSNGTARSVEDETRNAELNGNRNPEWWGNFSQMQIQIKQNLNLNLYREIPRNSNPIKISI